MTDSIEELLNRVDKLKVVSVGLKPGKERIANLTRSEHIGLSIIRDEELRPLKVCLTSEDKIHVVEPSIASNQTFLRDLLESRDVIVYTLDGTNDAETLADSMNILLRGQMDLPAMDISFRNRLALINGVQPSGEITYETNIEHMPHLKCLNYQAMVKRYLNLAIKDTECTKEEVESLRKYELSDIAINCIKRKSRYVRALALAIQSEARRLRDEPSKNLIYEFAIIAKDGDRNDFDAEKTNYYHDLRSRVNQIRLLEDE